VAMRVVPGLVDRLLLYKEWPNKDGVNPGLRFGWNSLVEYSNVEVDVRYLQQ
jgi:hypothetical protein